MAIEVITKLPYLLVSQIKEAIKNKDIITWDYDSDGDFTHSVDQWVNLAWMHPYVFGDKVIFGMIGRVRNNVTVEEYGVYHGRFVEMLLGHFDNIIDGITISVKGTKYDKLKATEV